MGVRGRSKRCFLYMLLRLHDGPEASSSPKKGSDKLNEFLPGNNLLVEKHQTAQKVLVNVLVVNGLPNLEREERHFIYVNIKKLIDKSYTLSKRAVST